MTFYPDAISDQQQTVLRELGSIAAEHGFYLAGGTAVALQLGHRRSVDLDWFSQNRGPLSDPMHWAQQLRDSGIELTTQSIDEATLHGSVHGVRVSFLEYRYPLLRSRVFWEEYDTDLASLDDLACMKLSAIAQRGARKDFLDLYAIVREHRPLSALIERYRQKYSTEDTAHLLYALVYFEDADKESMPVLLWDVQWSTVKETIRTWVRDVAS